MSEWREPIEGVIENSSETVLIVRHADEEFFMFL